MSKHSMLRRERINLEFGKTKACVWVLVPVRCPLQSPDRPTTTRPFRLPAVGYSKGYSKALEYKYRVKTAALGTVLTL
jgi:hypothetical protein